MKPISDLATAVQPGNGWYYETPSRKRTFANYASLDELTITHPQLQLAIDTARRWAARKQVEQDASLVLAGPVGTGKTHIARAILWSIRHTVDGEPVAPIGRFWIANDLIQALGAIEREGTYSRPSDMIPNTLPLVVIDDIGSEQVVPYVTGEMQQTEKANRYFKIIDYCYTWQISLIITTNLSIADLENCIGKRAYSRLMQMAPKGFMLELSQVPDYRRQASGR